MPSLPVLLLYTAPACCAGSNGQSKLLDLLVGRCGNRLLAGHAPVRNGWRLYPEVASGGRQALGVGGNRRRQFLLGAGGKAEG